MIRKLSLSGLVAAFACACGGSSTTTPYGGPSGANPSGVDLSGTWSATWTSRSGESGGGAMTLAQFSSSVTGTLTVDGSPCLTNGDINGSLTGDDLSAQLTAGGVSVTFDTTVTSAEMSGTYYAVSAGACTGDTGTIIASR